MKLERKRLLDPGLWDLLYGDDDDDDDDFEGDDYKQYGRDLSK